MSPRATEALGIGLLILAVLSVLGLWFAAGGPFGRLLQVGVKGAFGPGGYAMPVVAGYWAVLLLKGVPREERGRMLVGLIMTGLGILGVLSVAGGNPSPSDGYKTVSGAAGVIGAAVGWSLSRVASPYGAVAVCLGAAMLGALVFTATPLASFGRVVRRLVIGPVRAQSSEDEPEEPRVRRGRGHATEPLDAVVDMAGRSRGAQAGPTAADGPG
ncbi:MAG: hypothetical protein E6G40_13235 [Actinobacteria bacterium]|nr:MAG: hypothetical protein E6G40_13235 [Actinomycetota bacterium]